MNILFCNIGWMEFYRGLTSKDHIIGGGEFVNIEGTGHEVCNFAPYKGVVYGYVQPPRKKTQLSNQIQIKIDRLGANKNAPVVKGILVVWTATRPEGGTVVVGWYKNATVYRFYQQFTKIPKLHQKNDLHGFRIEAISDDVTLLPIDQRTCTIPRQKKGGMGKSNIWYADVDESQETVNKVRELISGKQVITQPSFSKKTDPDHNSKVEKAAISETRKYYESHKYIVESVEKDNVGWDLEASFGKNKLLIEVKGLSGSIASAQLTPNEFLAFNKKSENYRLAIVTEVLTSPKLLVCRYSTEDRCWVVDGNENSKIDIQERKSAIIQVSN